VLHYLLESIARLIELVKKLNDSPAIELSAEGGEGSRKAQNSSQSRSPKAILCFSLIKIKQGCKIALV